MENYKAKNNYLICIRHGERSDKVGIPKLTKLDPELTENGKIQCYEAAKQIIQYLKNKLSFKQSNTKISLWSSPYVRTIQTSKQIMNAINEDPDKDNKFEIDKINISYAISEMLEPKFRDFPSNFLYFLQKSDSVFNNYEFYKEEIKGLSFGSIDTQENLPSKFEQQEDCYLRMQKGVELVKNYFQNETEYENNVVIIATHATPLDCINQILGYPGPYGWKYITYCTTFIYNQTEELEISFVDKIQTIVKSDYIEKFDYV